MRDDGGSAVVEGVRESGLRLDELETVIIEFEVFEEGRADRQGINGGTNIVNEARQGEFDGADAAPKGFLGFVDVNAAASARDGNRGSEAVHARADDDSVGLGGLGS